MALLTPQEISIAGIDEVMVAADVAGDTFENAGSQFVRVSNGGGAPITVTPLVIQKLTTGETIAPTVINVPASEVRLFGPYSPNVYNDTSNVMEIDYSDVTGVTVAVFTLPRAVAGGIST